jgi:hypothetical protein
MAIDEFKDGKILAVAIVGAGEEVQIGEGEAAPGRAQDGEPRDPIHGMEQGAGEGEEIAELLTLGEALDFDGAEGDAALAQERDEFEEVGAGAHEDGDAVLAMLGAGALDRWEIALEDLEDAAGFLAAGVETFCASGLAVGDELRVDVDARGARGWIRRGCESKGDRSGAGRCGRGADGLEEFVERRSKAGVRAEIDGELNGVALDAVVGRPESVLANVREELDLSLAKHVDGLHGIADQKDRTFAGVGSRVPGFEEFRDEVVLTA